MTIPRCWQRQDEVALRYYHEDSLKNVKEKLFRRPDLSIVKERFRPHACTFRTTDDS